MHVWAVVVVVAASVSVLFSCSNFQSVYIYTHKVLLLCFFTANVQFFSRYMFIVFL